MMGEQMELTSTFEETEGTFPVLPPIPQKSLGMGAKPPVYAGRNGCAPTDTDAAVCEDVGGDAARLVEDGLIWRRGLRFRHVVRMGAPVERDPWVERLPGEAFNAGLRIVRSYERELDLHHLHFTWYAREVVSCEGQRDASRVVLWWVGKHETLRFAADLAALLFFRSYGRWPGTVWVRKLPESATPTVEVYDEEGKGFELNLEAAGWVPRRFVAVG